MMRAIYMGRFVDGVESWKLIIEDENGKRINVRNYYRRELEEMPFDRADDSGFGLVHATGYEYYDEVLGNWYAEYENDSAYLSIIGEL